MDVDVNMDVDDIADDPNASALVSVGTDQSDKQALLSHPSTPPIPDLSDSSSSFPYSFDYDVTDPCGTEALGVDGSTLEASICDC